MIELYLWKKLRQDADGLIINLENLANEELEERRSLINTLCSTLAGFNTSNNVDTFASFELD